MKSLTSCVPVPNNYLQNQCYQRLKLQFKPYFHRHVLALNKNIKHSLHNSQILQLVYNGFLLNYLLKKYNKTTNMETALTSFLNLISCKYYQLLALYNLKQYWTGDTRGQCVWPKLKRRITRNKVGLVVFFCKNLYLLCFELGVFRNRLEKDLSISLGILSLASMIKFKEIFSQTPVLY